jgi:hypothetical protein
MGMGLNWPVYVYGSMVLFHIYQDWGMVKYLSDKSVYKMNEKPVVLPPPGGVVGAAGAAAATATGH